MATGLALAALAVAVLTLPAGAGAHAERATFFPDPNLGDFPQLRTSGPALVVCAADTKERIKRFHGKPRATLQRQLKDCDYDSIQAAVNDADNGTRILVMPGVYEELGSRGPAPAGCEDVYQRTENGQYAISYTEQRQCPHAQNAIAILGDTDGDRICDSKCNIQIEGTGARPDDVVIEGQRAKLNVIRADRADGIVLRNFKVELSDFNNIYVLETNGFRIDRVESGYSREYGILSFTSDHGIYENCETYGNGDSGVYPGSGPDRHGLPDAHGHVYGIEIRNCNSHDNNIGSSGTAGNGTLFHDNRFHHNAIGVTTDSFAGGHPGMPQDASKWTDNLIYSNNKNIFSDDRDAYCKQPAEDRDPTVVCPTFQVPVGTGMLIAGGNDNIVEGNYIFDNWRRGTMLHWVPASFRGEPDPGKGFDTSNNNAYVGNCMGIRPANLRAPDYTTCEGTRDPNGVDFWWDEEEGRDCDPDLPGCVDTETLRGNCWSGNVGPDGGQTTSDPSVLPGCPGLDNGFVFPNISKLIELLPCSEWDPRTNTDPPGCNWFALPPEPN
jgi:Right handed beta helix region